MKLRKPHGYLSDYVQQREEQRYAGMIARNESWRKLGGGLIEISYEPLEYPGIRPIFKLDALLRLAGKR